MRFLLLCLERPEQLSWVDGEWLVKEAIPGRRDGSCERESEQEGRQQQDAFTTAGVSFRKLSGDNHFSFPDVISLIKVTWFFAVSLGQMEPT